MKIVLTVVDRQMTAEWASAQKGTCPISWLRSRVARCALLMPQDSLKYIVSSGDKWKEEASEDMQVCIASGTQLAERLFSSCLQAVVASKLEKQMVAGVAALCALKPSLAAAATHLTMEQIMNCRADCLKTCSVIAAVLLKIILVFER